MANVKISGLPAAAAVADANEFEINEAGTSKKVTGSQIAAYVDAELNPLTATDIGVTVQGYDADTTKNDVANTFTANQTINGDLTVDTNTLYVDSTNNAVGIGTSSPVTPLTIQRNGTTISDVNASTVLTLQSTGTSGSSTHLNLLSGSTGSTGQSVITFGDEDDTDIGAIIYRNADNSLAFQTNNTEHIRITSSGGVSFGSSGTAYGTSGQVLTSNGNAAPSWQDASGGGFTLVSSVASTSGNSINFTGIPATAKVIILMLQGVSTNGTGQPLIRIGDSGGLETTGYASYSCRFAGASLSGGGNNTTGFVIGGSFAAINTLDGAVQISLLDSSTNTWAAQGSLSESTDDNGYPVMGTKSLSGTLDRISVITPNTFDAGKISIMYQ